MGVKDTLSLVGVTQLVAVHDTIEDFIATLSEASAPGEGEGDEESEEA